MLFQETGINREFEHVIFVFLLGSFLAGYQVNLYIWMRVRVRAEGEGVEIESCSDKEKAKAGWGEKRERFLDPCCSFCREFLSVSPPGLLCIYQQILFMW